MKGYQIWGFSYLNCDGINVITGNENEADEEYLIPCFNGIALFEVNGECYACHYPDFNDLTLEQIGTIEEYCGYIPQKGEYGVICGALSKIKKVNRYLFEFIKMSFPVSETDKKQLNFKY